tara:strand:- start:1677 stop:2357 length:681 start_codon:yes stop_codon:yes gene_type:complete
MSRDLSNNVIANLEDEVIYPFFAVELNFDEGTFEGVDGNLHDRVLRLWTGFGTLVYNGQDYYGTGNLLDISSVEESTEIGAKGATLTLSGVPSEVISLALTEAYQGRTCNIHFGLIQKGSLELESSQEILQDYIKLEDGGKITLERVIVDLTQLFTGYMDQMSIDEGPDTSTVQLKVENKLIDLERARIGRFTSQHQKSIYPEDKGLDFVESLQDTTLNWGRSVNG